MTPSPQGIRPNGGLCHRNRVAEFCVVLRQIQQARLRHVDRDRHRRVRAVAHVDEPCLEEVARDVLLCVPRELGRQLVEDRASLRISSLPVGVGVVGIDAPAGQLLRIDRHHDPRCGCRRARHRCDRKCDRVAPPAGSCRVCRSCAASLNCFVAITCKYQSRANNAANSVMITMPRMPRRNRGLSVFTGAPS